MKPNQVTIINPLVSVRNDQVVTSSLQVAQHFKKNHFDVLKAIREIDCSAKFKESNFACSFYISELHNGGQKKHPLYYMTRDGFTFLAMGFTGKIAASFKEGYIKAFNEMEGAISNKLEERYIINELKNSFDAISKSLQSCILSLRKETGVSVGLCDLPQAIMIRKDVTLAQNLKYVLPVIHAGLIEGWWAIHSKVKLEKELNATKESVRDIARLLYKNHGIYPIDI